jgi:starch synthase
LVEQAHALDLKIIVDIVPHLNRASKELDDDCVVRCYDDSGHLVERASTDGRYGSWNDGKLLNYRKLEVWEWLANSITTLIEAYDIDGIRFDSSHAVPIMMKRNNYPYYYGKRRTHADMVEGRIVVNDREDDHFVTTGYYDSGCRDIIASPLHYFLMQSIEKVLRKRGKRFFVHIAECYWGREQILARTGIVPYNSALFKICEKIIHGKSDVREIYHLYDSYFPQALPEGTELLGILGNHDERRALNTFGHRGLRAAVGLTCFMSSVIMDYEGSAEGEGWKVFLDNIYVNWNQFESASHRSVSTFYRDIYRFHRSTRGQAKLIWANNNWVTAAVKASGDQIWIGAFNFSDENQNVALQFDKPGLPIEDSAFYRIVDPMYSPITGKHSYFTGKELKASRVHTVVTYTDRIKMLKVERIAELQPYYDNFLCDSFHRIIEADDGDYFLSNFAFLEVSSRINRYDRLSDFILKKLIGLFGADELGFGLKRIFYHIYKNRLLSARNLLDHIGRLAQDRQSELKDIGRKLEHDNQRRALVFISAEAEPFSKSGGLANVVYELPRELAALGESVYVITPFYRQGDDKAVKKMQQAAKRYGATYTDVNVQFKILEIQYEVGVHRCHVDGVDYFLLDHYELFDGLYWGYTAEEKLKRRIALARASAEVIIAFGLEPQFTLTNDAYAGLFNALVRGDPYYRENPNFAATTYLHIIHNGGWQYFDSYYRFERGFELFRLFNLDESEMGNLLDPHNSYNINCMAAGIRYSDRVITVSPSYARQIELACDGLEILLHDVIGINNALGRDFLQRTQQRFEESGILDETYPDLMKRIEGDDVLKRKIIHSFPELLKGPRACEKIGEPKRRARSIRVRNKLLLQLRSGITVDPEKILVTMIHRITEQKGFQLLLEASEPLFKELGLQGIIGGQVASGDSRGEEIARGLRQLADYYPDRVAVNIGFQDVSVPLLSSDVFLMPSMHEPGGISQLEALVCGCLVVARATGGLRDTVRPLRIRDQDVLGNGFLFSDFTPWSFLDAMSRCASLFRESDQETIDQARLNAKSSVYFWDTSAKRYIESLYNLKEIIRSLEN